MNDVSAIIHSLQKKPDLLDRYSDVLSDLIGAKASLQRPDDSAEMGLARAPAAAQDHAQSAPGAVSSEKLTKYVHFLHDCGIFKLKADLAPMEAEREVSKLSEKIADLFFVRPKRSDLRSVISELNSINNDVVRTTAPQELPGQQSKSKPVSGTERETQEDQRTGIPNTDAEVLSAIFERANEVTSASRGGRPSEGYQPRKESRIRLEPENVEWLKQKGPNYLSRINGILTALREAEQSALHDLSADSTSELDPK